MQRVLHLQMQREQKESEGGEGNRKNVQAALRVIGYREEQSETG